MYTNIILQITLDSIDLVSVKILFFFFILGVYLSQNIDFPFIYLDSLLLYNLYAIIYVSNNKNVLFVQPHTQERYNTF